MSLCRKQNRPSRQTLVDRVSFRFFPARDVAPGSLVSFLRLQTQGRIAFQLFVCGIVATNYRQPRTVFEFTQSRATLKFAHIIQIINIIRLTR